MRLQPDVGVYRLLQRQHLRHDSGQCLVRSRRRELSDLHHDPSLQQWSMRVQRDHLPQWLLRRQPRLPNDGQRVGTVRQDGRRVLRMRQRRDLRWGGVHVHLDLVYGRVLCG